jgi:hypothetical protein
VRYLPRPANSSQKKIAQKFFRMGFTVGTEFYTSPQKIAKKLKMASEISAPGDYI